MSTRFLAILSPSKLMNEMQQASLAETTVPVFLYETEILCNELKHVSAEEWKKKMAVSSEIAENTKQRFNTWEKANIPNGIPAASLFSGEAFKALDANSFTKNNWKSAQKHLRILSGFYGMLKATDATLPYRLMVGTPYKTTGGMSLYAYWSNKITQEIESEIEKNGCLLNLASDEYFKLIDLKNFNREIIHFKFFQQKGKDLKSIPTFSKQARGSMARFVIETHPKKKNELQSFDKDGYSFNASLSSSNEMVFVR